jgi:hypothetical protein
MVVEKIMPDKKAKKWPVAMTAAFFLVLIASFMPWGTIRYHYTPSFMLLMEHPGLANRTISEDDLSTLKRGARLNRKASAWKTGFDILGFFYPHFLLAILSLFLFAIALCRFYDYFLINPSIPQLISFYGVIHVAASALGLLSQGSIGWGLVLTGIGYVIFCVIFLRWN